MRRFWAIRRIDRDYVEPTLYKSEAAARSAAASRRGYDVLALFSETEARSADPVAWRCKDFADGWIIYQQESAAAAYRAETGCLVEPLYTLPTPPKAEADHG